MSTVDFTNAFNMIDQSTILREARMKFLSIFVWVEFLYDQTSRLYLGDMHIMSATRVQQDDPLGPLLFALVLHPLIHQISNNCKVLLHVGYLDDGTIIGESEEVVKALDIIREIDPRLGLELNIHNNEIFWPSCNDSKLHEELFPSNIRRPMLGMNGLLIEIKALLRSFNEESNRGC
ncbi:unnamed protein product [Lathyrus oleraceus]